MSFRTALLRSAPAASVLMLSVLGASLPASAQVAVELNEVAAALALPLIGDSLGASTFITLTNVGAEDRNLHLNAISGDGWHVTDFDCPVTASETVQIHWMPDPNVPERYRLTLECNLAGELKGRVVERAFDWRSGLLFVANESHECRDGTCTVSENELLGDFIVVGPARGVSYSAEAIPFQSRDVLAPGASDRDYHFDNSEYSMFPSTVAANFIAPGPGLVPGMGDVTADLILFTLDGRPGRGPRAALDVVFFDDDETPTSAHFDFDCFAVVGLEDINANFASPFLGSGAGHFFMTGIDADQASNTHDTKFGNGNAIRVVGVHGWLVQSARAGLQVPGPTGELTPTGDRVYWARSLSQGLLAQHVDGSDVPTFDGF